MVDEMLRLSPSLAPDFKERRRAFPSAYARGDRLLPTWERTGDDSRRPPVGGAAERAAA